MKNLSAVQGHSEILRCAQNDMKSAIYDRAKYIRDPVTLLEEHIKPLDGGEVPMLNERLENIIPLLKGKLVSSDQLQEDPDASGYSHSLCPGYPPGFHVIGEEAIAPDYGDR